jgi:hypothetical protein
MQMGLMAALLRFFGFRPEFSAQIGADKSKTPITAQINPKRMIAHFPKP